MEFKANTIINNRYKIISEIGKGASSIVYLCLDSKIHKNVALKIQNRRDEFSNMDKRFKLEAATLLNLNHPNIVETYDYFRWNERRVIVMEYVKGKTLEKYIHERKYLFPKEVAYFGIQILKALDHVHQNGVMHRDLKPANITISTDNTLKLMDFGIVQTSINQELTKQASIIGTIQYLAPEIFKGEKSSPPSEMFSMGVLLYRMATGVLPFKGTNSEETARKILNNEPLPLTKINPDIDKELESIILKLLNKDYYERFQSAKETSTALDNYLSIKGYFKDIENIDYSLLQKEEKISKKIKYKDETKDKKIMFVNTFLITFILILLIIIVITLIFLFV